MTAQEKKKKKSSSQHCSLFLELQTGLAELQCMSEVLQEKLNLVGRDADRTGFPLDLLIIVII